jgi:hypothetical protein
MFVIFCLLQYWGGAGAAPINQLKPNHYEKKHLLFIPLRDGFKKIEVNEVSCRVFWPDPVLFLIIFGCIISALV